MFWVIVVAYLSIGIIHAAYLTYEWQKDLKEREKRRTDAERIAEHIVYGPAPYVAEGATAGLLAALFIFLWPLLDFIWWGGWKKDDGNDNS